MDEGKIKAKQVLFQGQGPAYNVQNVGNIVCQVKYNSYTQCRPLEKKCFVNDPVELFTGREDELRQVHVSLHRNSDKRQKTVLSQTTIIVGLGGVGKTQLARKYVQMYEHEHQRIIWINTESLRYSFTELAKKFGMQIDAGDETKSIVENVYRHLAMDNCLFIFDNAEFEDILNFLPSNNYSNTYPTPYVLITSRNNKWDGILDGIHVDIVSLKEWKLNEAIDFVQKGLGILNDDYFDDIKNFVKMLQFYPLAINQAIAYIQVEKKENSQFTIGDYIERYRANAEKLLQFNFKGLKFYGHTTIATFELSLQKIDGNELHGKTAMKILYVLGYLAPMPIKRESLKLLTANSADGLSELITAVNLLVKYSIVYNEWGGQEVISVHRVVQDVTRLRINSLNENEAMLDESIKLLRGGFTKMENIYHLEAVWSHAIQHSNFIIKHFDKNPTVWYVDTLASLNTVLHALVKSGNYDLISAILAIIKTEPYFSKVINATEGSSSPLHWAVVEGHFKIAQLLIENQADVNSENISLETPLHHALKRPNNMNIVKLLVSNGAKVNVANKNGEFPIQMAVDVISKFTYTVVKNDEKWLVSAKVPNGIVHLTVTDVPIPYDDITKDDKAIELLVDLKNGRPLSGRLQVIALSVFVSALNPLRKTESSIVQNLKDSTFVTFNYVVDKSIYNEILDVVEYLLENGANVNACNGMTPLILASEINDMRFFKMLLQKGVNVDVANICKYTPLHYAAINSNAEMAKLLVEQDRKNIDDQNDGGNTALHEAATQGALDTIDVLLEAGANQNTLNRCRLRPLALVPISASNLWDILKCFMKHGTDANSKLLDGTTFLHHAVKNNDLNAVKFLVAQKARIDEKDLLGRTPLFVAGSGRDKCEIIKFLVENGADINVSVLGHTPVQIAARYCNLKVLECYGVPDAEDLMKKENYDILCSPLQFNEKYKKYLGVDYPGDVRSREMESVRSFLNEMKENVEDVGQYVNATDRDGNTPLFWAAHNGKPITAEVLIEYGADVNVKNVKNKTALHWAVKCALPETVRLLIQNNIDHSIKDTDGNTPLDLAEKMLKANPFNEKVQSIINILIPLHIENIAGMVKILAPECANQIIDIFNRRYNQNEIVNLNAGNGTKESEFPSETAEKKEENSRSLTAVNSDRKPATRLKFECIWRDLDNVFDKLSDEDVISLKSTFLRLAYEKLNKK